MNENNFYDLPKSGPCNLGNMLGALANEKTPRKAAFWIEWFLFLRVLVLPENRLQKQGEIQCKQGRQQKQRQEGKAQHQPQADHGAETQGEGGRDMTKG